MNNTNLSVAQNLTFVSDVPELVCSWDFEKNVGIDARTVKAMSNKSFWFKCPICGHSWETTVCDKYNSVKRKLKRGLDFRKCPACEGVAVCNNDYRNSLAKEHPEIVDCWVNEKNDVSPLELTTNTHRKVWLKCKRCHKPYLVLPKVWIRTFGCRHCSIGRRSSFGEQFLFRCIKEHFPTAINGDVSILGNYRELDIYVPNHEGDSCGGFACEWDGARWHQNDEEVRKWKYERCRELDIKLIRVSETHGQSKYKTDDRFCDAWFKCVGTSDYDDLDNVATEILKYVGTDGTHKSCTVYESEILAELRNHVAEKSVANHEVLRNLWDKDLNEVDPKFVTSKSGHRYWFRCPSCGDPWLETPANVLKIKKGCAKCARNEKVQVEQWSKDGNKLIKVWKSMSDIERELGYFSGYISKTVNGKYDHAYGFVWKRHKT